MLSKNIRRCLSFVIALVMVFALMSFQALGAETETDDHDHENETQTTAAPESTTASEPSETLVQIQTKIDDILTRYLGATEMSAEDISAKVAAMDWETYQTARSEISELENSDEIQQLTETDLQTLLDDNAVLCAFSDALEAKAAADNSVSLLTTVNVLDGQVSVTDTANSNTVSGGTVTIKAAGSLFSKKTNTVTITNETESTATLSFDYTASTYNSFTIAGASASASGTYSALLDPDATVTLVLVSNSGLSNRTATLTLSNFSLTAAAEASNVTFNYDSALGSITVGGTAVASGTTQEVSLADGAALMATANSGTTFHGWIDESTGAVLSYDASYTLIPTADVTVKPVFTGTNSAPHFMLGVTTKHTQSYGLLGMQSFDYHTVSSTHIFDDLNAAAKVANNSTSKIIVPINDGTLSAGTYTIPAGVTLLIPFDLDNTLYTTAAQALQTYTPPEAYRTLTLADGANLVINGSMSLSAKHTYAAGSSPYYCTPAGAYGLVETEDNSSITVKNGGSLYAYGYITGSGSVTAESGATVYELFQIMDFRGGTQSSDMENGVFPLFQYYVQNIEIPLTLEYGAKEYGYTTVYASRTSFGTAVKFIGSSDCMFNMSSGSVIKSYDGSTDRLTVELKDGTMNIASIELTLSNFPINSSSYDLAVNNNLTIKLTNSDVTINQDLAVLPGAQIIIEEDASCTLGSGINIYVYDSDQWGNYCFSGGGNKMFAPVRYSPSKTYTRTAADLVNAAVRVDGTVNASGGYIYTTAGGANIYSTGSGQVKVQPGTQTVTHQLVQGTGYTEIPITSALLKNADGTYVKTASAANTYTYTNGVWTCEVHTFVSGTPVSPTCTTEGYTTYTCSVCQHSYNGDTVASAGHTWNDATCTTPKTCSICGETEGNPLDHDWTDATCTAPKICSLCGETEGESLEHTWDGNKCSICSVSAAAEVNDTKYVTLSAALETAAAGDTIKLLQNPAESDVVQFNKSVIVDVNGIDAYEVSCAEGWGYADNQNGTYTVYNTTLKVGGATLLLESIVNINFYFLPTGFEAIDLTTNAGLIVWTGDEGAYSEGAFTIDNENVTQYSGTVVNRDYYKAMTGGIAAKELGDEHYMRLYVKLPNGSYVYSESHRYGPQVYALKKLAASDSSVESENLKKLMVAMLDYAAAAQKQFNYKTDDLANIISNADVEEYGVTTESLENYRTDFDNTMLQPVTNAAGTVMGGWERNREDCPGVFASLILEGIITNNFSFKFTQGIMDKVETAEFLFWNTTDYNDLMSQGKTFDKSNATEVKTLVLDESDGFYKAGYDKTAVKNLGDSIYVCAIVTTSDGTTYNSGVISYSGHTFINNSLTNSDEVFVNLVKCLGVYSDAAKTFFPN